MSLGTRIQAARNGAGISQEELARRVNVSEKSIRRYESGESEPLLRHLKDIAAALTVSVEHLIIGADESEQVAP